MRVTSSTTQRASQKNDKHEADSYMQSPRVIHGGALPTILVTATGDRHFHVYLNPEEVVRCLLALPSDRIAKAVVDAYHHDGALTNLPEALKQLTSGAMAAAKIR